MIVPILEWAAWVTSAVLLTWMIFDTIRTGRAHDEEFLTTSVEGTDELLDPASATGGPR